MEFGKDWFSSAQQKRPWWSETEPTARAPGPLTSLPPSSAADTREGPVRLLHSEQAFF